MEPVLCRCAGHRLFASPDPYAPFLHPSPHPSLHPGGWSLQTPSRGSSVFCLQVGLGPWGAWLEARGSACKRCSGGIHSPKSLVVGCVLLEGGALPSSQFRHSLLPQAVVRWVPLFQVWSSVSSPCSSLYAAPLSHSPQLPLLSCPSLLTGHWPPPTVSPRNAHLLISWTQQAISPPRFAHALSPTKSSLSLLRRKDPSESGKIQLRYRSPLSGKPVPFCSWLFLAISHADSTEEGTGPPRSAQGAIFKNPHQQI